MDMLMMRVLAYIAGCIVRPTMVVSNDARCRRVCARNGCPGVDATADARLRWAEYEFIKLGAAMDFAVFMVITPNLLTLLNYYMV